MEFADRQVWTSKEVAKLLAVVNSEVQSGDELLDNLPAGLLVIAPDLALLGANRPLRRLLGLGERPLAELRLEDLFPEEEVRRGVLETFESCGKQVDLESRARASLRITARSYGSWPEDRKALLLVQEAPENPAVETNPGRVRPEATAPMPRAAPATRPPARGWPGALRAGIILAFVMTGILRRLLLGAATPPASSAGARAKVVPFPELVGRVPEVDLPRRTATG